ncbi:hypothetical protein L195_g040978, partial [Trifolium pratense]
MKEETFDREHDEGSRRSESGQRVCMSGKIDICIDVGIFVPRFPNLWFGETKRRNEGGLVGNSVDRSKNRAFLVRILNSRLEVRRQSDWHYDTLFPKFNQVNIV